MQLLRGRKEIGIVIIIVLGAEVLFYDRPDKNALSATVLAIGIVKSYFLITKRALKNEGDKVKTTPIFVWNRLEEQKLRGYRK